MLEKMNTPHTDIIAFEAIGKITQEDYINKILPTLEEAVKADQKLRFLFYLGPRFEGFTAGAAWQDFKVGLNYTSLFEKCAVVSDLDWLRGLCTFFGSFMPCAVQTFKNGELEASMAWLNSGLIGLDYQLDSEKGLLEVEISSPLTSATFEKLSHVIDPYLEKNGKLSGLILHLREFPGWEDFGSLVSHIQFIKNHHEKIQRVAFSAGGQVAHLVPLLSKHFVKAEVKQFDYDKLDDAKAWAAGN